MLRTAVVVINVRTRWLLITTGTRSVHLSHTMLAFPIIYKMDVFPIGLHPVPFILLLISMLAKESEMQQDAFCKHIMQQNGLRPRPGIRPDPAGGVHSAPQNP